MSEKCPGGKGELNRIDGQYFVRDDETVASCRLDCEPCKIHKRAVAKRTGQFNIRRLSDESLADASSYCPESPTRLTLVSETPIQETVPVEIELPEVIDPDEKLIA